MENYIIVPISDCWWLAEFNLVSTSAGKRSVNKSLRRVKIDPILANTIDSNNMQRLYCVCK